jgi:hypothetical protein
VQQLIAASGKLELLDKMMYRLKERGHRWVNFKVKKGGG